MFIDGFEPYDGGGFEFLTASALEGADSLSFSVFNLADDLDFEIVIDVTSIAIAIMDDPNLTVAQNDPQLPQGPSQNASSAMATTPAKWALMLAGGPLLRIRRRR